MKTSKWKQQKKQWCDGRSLIEQAQCCGKDFSSFFKLDLVHDEIRKSSCSPFDRLQQKQVQVQTKAEVEVSQQENEDKNGQTNKKNTVKTSNLQPNWCESDCRSITSTRLVDQHQHLRLAHSYRQATALWWCSSELGKTDEAMKHLAACSFALATSSLVDGNGNGNGRSDAGGITTTRKKIFAARDLHFSTECQKFDDQQNWPPGCLHRKREQKNVLKPLRNQRRQSKVSGESSTNSFSDSSVFLVLAITNESTDYDAIVAADRQNHPQDLSEKIQFVGNHRRQKSIQMKRIKKIHQHQYQPRHSQDQNRPDFFVTENPDYRARPRAASNVWSIALALVTIIALTQSVPVAESVDCFKCSSRNGSNPACEDPFHNLNTTRVVSPILPDPIPQVVYHTPCYAGKKGRDGMFPASACIKLTGIFDTTGETLVVRHCAMDSGTLTQDTELARMSHCGKFQFEGDLLRGCVLACPEDACNSAMALGCHSSSQVAIMATVVSLIAMALATSKGTNHQHV